MPIDPSRVLNWEFPVSEQVCSARDAMLYALGVGLGADPTDEVELAYLYERQLMVLPTMAAVIGHPGPWYSDPRTGIDWVHVVHGEQALEIHQPLLTGSTFRCETRVVDVEDKGAGRGALVRWQRRLLDVGTGALVATADSTLFCRKDGGFGGSPRPKTEPVVWPQTNPTGSVHQSISSRAGLIYRLSGDFNPVHVDPKVAVDAGFDRPILHGLCTFAHATWAVLREVAGGDASALISVAARFKAPVYPGQELRTDIWREDTTIRFRSYADSDTLVLDSGRIELRKVEAGN
jgi:acyl dehydratase